MEIDQIKTDKTIETKLDRSVKSGEVVLKVEKLWKVFGKDPKRVFRSPYSSMDKPELIKKTGCVIALNDINLEIKKGEFYVLMGLSGSGKSTLIRTLTKLVNPTKGSVIANGKNIVKMNPEELRTYRRTQTAMVFQHYGLLPHMNVLDNAAFGLKIKGLDKETRNQKALEALETVGLKGWEDSYPLNLSGGMQQRVGLARALANEPEILLMDEPFSGLDPLIRREMQDQLIEIQENLKKTIIFVTHDLHEALKLGDRISIMQDGKIIQTGTPEEVVTEPANDYVREFVQDASPSKVLTASSIMEDPAFLLYEWEGPATALHMLRSSKKSYGFLVGRGNKYLGLVLEKDLKRDMDKTTDAKVKEKKKSLLELCAIDLQQINPDSYVEELFPYYSERIPYPLPVVNEKGVFIGQIKAEYIFANMVNCETGGSDV